MVRLTLRMPDKLNEELKEKAKEQNISKNALIIRACKELIIPWREKEKNTNNTERRGRWR